MFPPVQENTDSSIREMLDNSPIGATITSCETGRLLLWNTAFEKIVGASSAQEILNADLAKTWVDKTLHAEIRNKIRTNANIVNLEAERIRFDNSHCWTLLNSQTLIFEGELAELFWQIDITERKRTEYQVQENERRLKQIFEASPVAIGITRESDSTIQYANSKYSELFGYAHDEILGHQASEMWARQEDRTRFREIYAQYGFVDQMEALGLHRDGREIWVSLSWKPFEYAGEPCHLFWIYDISEQKENESALSVAKEQAEAATQAKSNFLATMSHEIRTPLNGVLGIAQILKKSKLDKAQLGYVDTILSSGSTLLEIINDVLDVSKIESGEMVMEAQLFQLDDLLSTILHPFEAAAVAKNISLSLSTEIEKNTPLHGDIVRLRQILWNLIGNAIKFTENGEVLITLDALPAIDAQSVLSGKLDKSTKVYKFSIVDTGTGIAADKLDSIFTPFTQEDNSITRKFGGTGLGLSIVKNLAELMGGSVSVTSVVGKGSQFDLILPLTAPAKLAAPTQPNTYKPAPYSALKCFKILVAEDNAVNAAIITAFLENANHEVRHVTDGALAVEQAKQNWADLILMDIHMPNMNGMEATQLIRSQTGNTKLPILALTADAFDHSRQQFLDAGMNDVITKPFTEDQILKTVSEYICT